jgi:hypothetical protein
LLLWPASLLAAPSFIANLRDEEIAQGDSTMLTLSLTDARALENPDTSSLKSMFDIRAQKRVNSLVNIDGTQKQVMKWHYELLPKRAGRLVVPGFTMATDQGQMTSRPIYLTVTADPAAAKARAQVQAQAVTARAPRMEVNAAYSDPSPMLGQAVMLKVELLRGPNVLEVVLQPPSGSQLRVERVGKPVNEFVRTAEGGMTRSRVEFAVTGLAAGPARLNPIPLTGTVFNMLGPDMDMFGDLDDPTALLNKMMRQNGISEPFRQELQTPGLSIQPVPSGWTHGLRAWLPAWEVTLNQRAEGLQTAKTGEPILREITLVATGVLPENLPKLETLLRASLSENEWQLYPGEPDTGMEIDPDHQTVTSYVTQKFTYIPLKPGRQELPALSIPWWNLSTRSEDRASLPSMPFDAAKGEGIKQVPEGAAQAMINSPEEEEPTQKSASWLRILWLAGLVALVGAAWWWSKGGRFTWLSLLQPVSFRAGHSVRPASSPARPFGWKEQLNKAHDAATLLQAASRAMPRQEPGEPLSQTAERDGQTELASLLRQLEGTAYGGKAGVDIAALRPRLHTLLEHALKTRAESGATQEQADIWKKLNG